MIDPNKIECDRVDSKLIVAWYEPYCISSSRSEPTQLALEDEETVRDYCCSSQFRRCPHYSKSKLELPADAS
jgi:hypothetical protein